MAGNFIDYFNPASWMPKAPAKQPINLPDEFSFDRVVGTRIREKSIPEFDALVSGVKKVPLSSANPSSIGLGKPHTQFASHRTLPNSYGPFEEFFPKLHDRSGPVDGAYEYGNAGKSSAQVADKLRYQAMDEAEDADRKNAAETVIDELFADALILLEKRRTQQGRIPAGEIDTTSASSHSEASHNKEEQLTKMHATPSRASRTEKTTHEHDDFVKSITQHKQASLPISNDDEEDLNNAELATPTSGESIKKKRGPRSSHGSTQKNRESGKESATKETVKSQKLFFEGEKEDSGIDDKTLSEVPLGLFLHTIQINSLRKEDDSIHSVKNIGARWRAVKSLYKKEMDATDYKKIFYDDKDHKQLTWGEIRLAAKKIDKWQQKNT